MLLFSSSVHQHRFHFLKTHRPIAPDQLSLLISVVQPLRFTLLEEECLRDAQVQWLFDLGRYQHVQNDFKALAKRNLHNALERLNSLTLFFFGVVSVAYLTLALLVVAHLFVHSSVYFITQNSKALSEWSSDAFQVLLLRYLWHI